MFFKIKNRQIFKDFIMSSLLKIIPWPFNHIFKDFYSISSDLCNKK